MKTLHLKFRNSDESTQIAFLDDALGQSAFEDINLAKRNKYPNITISIPHGRMALEINEIVAFSIVDNNASEKELPR
jgi:hypothetical protein